MTTVNVLPLSELNPGETGIIESIDRVADGLLPYGLCVGSKVRIFMQAPFDASSVVLLADRASLGVSKSLLSKIFVRKFI